MTHAEALISLLRGVHRREAGAADLGRGGGAGGAGLRGAGGWGRRAGRDVRRGRARLGAAPGPEPRHRAAGLAGTRSTRSAGGWPGLTSRWVRPPPRCSRGPASVRTASVQALAATQVSAPPRVAVVGGDRAARTLLTRALAVQHLNATPLTPAALRATDLEKYRSVALLDVPAHARQHTRTAGPDQRSGGQQRAGLAHAAACPRHGLDLATRLARLRFAGAARLPAGAGLPRSAGGAVLAGHTETD
jgi:hypothetical protein